MATRSIGQPRRIDPSLIEIGDDVSVEHKLDRGIITTLRGVVRKRIDSGQTRYYMTEEGATLFAWEPHRTNLVKITLYGREEKPQTTLFELDNAIKERLAG